MRLLRMTAILLLVLACGGCSTWLGITKAEGDVRVAVADARTGQISDDPPQRLVVIKFWRLREGNRADDVQLLEAFAANRCEFPISFAFRAYPVTVTREGSVQHAVPDAGVIVFAEGYWPAYCLPDDGRGNLQPPRKVRLDFEVVLQKDEGAPEDCCGQQRWRTEMFPPLIYRLGSLERVLSSGQGITAQDEMMVYRQLAKYVLAEEPQPTDASGGIAGAATK